MKDSDFRDCLKKWSKIVEKNAKTTKSEGTFFYPKAPSDTTPHDLRLNEWRSIIRGAAEISADRDEIMRIDKIDEAKEEDGFGPLVRGNKQITKGDVTYETNPITFNSVGPDAAPYDGPNRVSKMSDSEDLDTLAKLKTEVEVLERRVHKLDVSKSNKKFIKLSKKLKSLRNKVNELSEKLQSKPESDVT